MQADLTHAAEVLRQGGVCVLPTDTVYGLVASANNQAAVERVYTIKRRNPAKPCIILIADKEDLKQFGVPLSPKVVQELSRLWPGPVSVVLPCAQKAFSRLTRDTGSLAFRLPDSEPLRAFLRITGPLIAPSANPEGLPTAATVGEARAYFGDLVDCYVDGGELKNPPSALIALDESGAARVLRGTATYKSA